MHHFRYIFHIKPEYFELSYNQSQVFEIMGQSRDPRHVEEEFFCYALIDTISKMCLVTSFTMKAKFVEPTLSIKKPVLDVLLARDSHLELEGNISI